MLEPTGASPLNSLKNQPMKYASLPALILTSILIGGCAAPPTYEEPDPSITPVAKLRVSVGMGMIASVSVHPNNDEKNCLIEENKKTLPVETNTSGFPRMSQPKTIGIPGFESEKGWVESEIHIPASDDLTFAVSYSWLHARGGRYICSQAVRFSPREDRSYRIRLFAGDPTKSSFSPCYLELREIHLNDAPPLNSVGVKETPYSLVVVKHSKLWGLLCSANQQANGKG